MSSNAEEQLRKRPLGKSLCWTALPSTKGAAFRRAGKSGLRTRARRLEFWGRFDAGRSNLPGLRLLASDQGLRLASQSRGYLQKDDETQPKKQPAL